MQVFDHKPRARAWDGVQHPFQPVDFVVLAVRFILAARFKKRAKPPSRSNLALLVVEVPGLGIGHYA